MNVRLPSHHAIVPFLSAPVLAPKSLQTYNLLADPLRLEVQARSPTFACCRETVIWPSAVLQFVALPPSARPCRKVGLGSARSANLQQEQVYSFPARATSPPLPFSHCSGSEPSSLARAAKIRVTIESCQAVSRPRQRLGPRASYCNASNALERPACSIRNRAPTYREPASDGPASSLFSSLLRTSHQHGCPR